MTRITFSFSLFIFCCFTAFSQPYWEFDGSNDYIAVPEFHYNSTGIQEATVEAWIKTTSNGFIASWDRSEYWRLEIVSGKLRWDVRIGGSIVDFSGHQIVTDGQWHHVAGVVDHGTLLIYVDGLLDNSTSPGGTMGTGATRYGFIGTGSEATEYDGARGGTLFKGQMDEVRVWNAALDQTTLNEWKNKALSPSHPYFSDLAYCSTALDFDGNNDYVTAGDVAFLDAPTTFTISMWFKRRSDQYNSTNSNHSIGNVLIAQSSDASNDNLEIGTHGSNVDIYLDSGSGSEDSKQSFSADIQDNTWHHIALTYDGNAGNPEANIYLDGTLLAQESAWTGVLDNSGSSPLTFGIARGGSSNWGDFDGQIDEIRIFDVVLSQSTIREYMYKGINTHPNLADLQIYYPVYLTGNSTTTVPDVDGDDVTIDATMSSGMDPEVNRVAEVAVPTLPQWGVIILSLLTLSLVVLLAGNKQLVLAGSGMKVNLVEMIQYSFNKTLYFNILKILLPLAVIGFVVVHIIFGTNGLLDFAGTIISFMIVGYIVLLFKNKAA